MSDPPLYPPLYRGAQVKTKWRGKYVYTALRYDVLMLNTRSVAAGFGRHGMPSSGSNDTGTALGEDGSDWSRDLATLTFDLEDHGACGWYGSSSSIRIPSLKSVGLAVRKIWRTMCVSINGPDDLDLWPFDRETGVRVASKEGNLPSKFGHDRPLGSRISRYVRDGRTDERTDGQKQRLLPIPYGRVIIIWRRCEVDYCDMLLTTTAWRLCVIDVTSSQTYRTNDFTRFTGVPALPVAITLLMDVESYKHSTDWWDIVSTLFYASASCARRRLSCFYSVPLSRCLSRCPAPTSAFFCASHKYWTDLGEMWEIITRPTTNRWTDYILGEIIPGSREHDTAENFNGRHTGAAV